MMIVCFETTPVAHGRHLLGYAPRPTFLPTIVCRASRAVFNMMREYVLCRAFPQRNEWGKTMPQQTTGPSVLGGGCGGTRKKVGFVTYRENEEGTTIIIVFCWATLPRWIRNTGTRFSFSLSLLWLFFDPFLAFSSRLVGRGEKRGLRAVSIIGCCLRQ
jgi:hypothetical protein